MNRYIDGFVLPIPRESLQEYKRAAESIASIWKEHGAIDYWECVGDDMHLEGTRSFNEAAGATKEEVIVFGWVMFESRAARDEANNKVCKDPRMDALVQPLIDPSNPIFKAERMMYGGFKPLVGSQNDGSS